MILIYFHGWMGNKWDNRGIEVLNQRFLRDIHVEIMIFRTWPEKILWMR